MIFFTTSFWQPSGMFALVQSTSEGREYNKLLMCTYVDHIDHDPRIDPPTRSLARPLEFSDSVDDTVEHLIAYRASRNLPVLSEIDLESKFWAIDRAHAASSSTDHST